MRPALSALLPLCALFLACSSPPPAPAVPQWDAIPSGVADALCTRLKMDAIATGDVTVVRVTQPLVTPENIAALAGISSRSKVIVPESMLVNRAVPVGTVRGACAWVPIDVRDMPKHFDEMVVEISAPIPNPYERGQAGLFARVSLAEQHPTWYWIPLLPRGEGWSAGFVSVLPR